MKLNNKGVILAGVVGTALAFPVSAVQLLSNGNFETGTFAGWTLTDQFGGSGTTFLSAPGAATPFSGLPTAANALGGSWYAVTDQTGPGSHALSQAFTVAPGSSVTVSFDLFINNWDTALYNNGLDYTISQNENGRVDILNAAANALSTAPADIVTTLIAPAGPTAGVPLPYVNYSFNITGAVGSGGTYQIRFAESDNQGFFNLGVDNVSINAVPEPASAALLGAAALFLLRRKVGRQ